MAPARFSLGAKDAVMGDGGPAQQNSFIAHSFTDVLWGLSSFASVILRQLIAADVFDNSESPLAMLFSHILAELASETSSFQFQVISGMGEFYVNETMVHGRRIEGVRAANFRLPRDTAVPSACMQDMRY